MRRIFLAETGIYLLVALAATMIPFFFPSPITLPFAVLLAIALPIARVWQLRQAQVSSHEFVQRLIDVIPEPVYVKDSLGRYVMINAAFAQQRKQKPEEILGLSANELAPNREVADLVLEEDFRVLRQGDSIFKEDYDTDKNTGRERWRIATKGRCLNAHGEPVIVGANFDISALRLAERAAQERLENEIKQRELTQDFIQRLIDVIPDPVYIKKAGGLYVMVNEAFLEYHQRPREEVMAGPNSMRYTRPDIRQVSLAEDDAVLAGEEVQKEEHTTRKATGEEVYRIVTKRRSVYLDGDPVVVGIDHHITRWRVAERELKRLAEEDALTGIANRRHFRNEAEHALRRANRYREVVSIIMFDLDHFKHVNDTWGHNVGDEVLREAVKRSVSSLRNTDFAGRWGGEEFVVLLVHTALDEASIVAERLRAAIASEAFLTSAGNIPVTISGGVTQWLKGDTFDSLIERADAALYRAKESGRNKMLLAEIPA